MTILFTIACAWIIAGIINYVTCKLLARQGFIPDEPKQYDLADSEKFALLGPIGTVCIVLLLLLLLLLNVVALFLSCCNKLCWAIGLKQ